MDAGTLQVTQKAPQHTGLISEWHRSSLTAPETATFWVHTDFIHGLAHGVPVLGIGKGEQLPLHARPTQMQRDGAGIWAIGSQVQQPAITLASWLYLGLGGD
ncbi:hypothetical protein VU14_15900 [Aeromonas hydrophila]|nr:hypothetical protein VU14_15900 [Aeromonas hydrophila]